MLPEEASQEDLSFNKRKHLTQNFIRFKFPDLPDFPPDSLVDEERLDEFHDLLRFSTFKPSELWLRSLFDFFFLNLNHEIRTGLTSCLKYLRNRDQSLKIRYPLEGELNKLLIKLAEEHETREKVWKGKSAALCLTHDVDNLGGYRFSPVMMKMDFDQGIPSVFNFLSKGDYLPDQNFMAELQREGFEIGSHGIRHELGLARKPLHKWEEEFKQCLGYWNSMGVQIRGFRAPAFSITEDMLSVFEKTGVVYDSSIQVCNGHYPSCGVSFPYRYPGTKIWEIPLSIQDDLFFRDARISPEETLSVLEKVLQQTIELGGLVCFNFHPCLMKDRVSFYKDFLKMLNIYREDVWFVTGKELCFWLEERSEGVMQ